MSAKFIAQIEISNPCVSSASSPAEASEAEDRQHQRQPGGDERAEGEHEDRERHRPGDRAPTSSSPCGSPSLKSLHMPDAPVSATLTSVGRRPRAASTSASSAAATIAVGSPRAPADHDRGVAVGGDAWRRARRRRTDCDPASAAQQLLDAARRRLGRPGRSAVRPGEWTTTISAELERPAKFCLDQRARLRPTPSRSPASRRRRARSRPSARRREHDGDDAPGDRDQAQVIGRPAAEPAERADRAASTATGASRTSMNGHSTSPSLAVPTICYYYTNKSL